MICGGGKYSLVVSGTTGKIWSFGGGEYGRLGHGGEEYEQVPRLIEALARVMVIQVAAGYMHSIALTSDGDVFTWGCGETGRLGHGNAGNHHVSKQVEGIGGVVDIAAGYRHSLAVEGEEGAVYVWGDNNYGQLGLGGGEERHVPTVVPGVSGVVTVTAGNYHSLALSKDGTVVACGRYEQGQLGLGDTDQRDIFTVVPD